MKLFLDSADLPEIKDALAAGVISGITTNPTLMRRAGVTDYLSHTRAIRELIEDSECKIDLSLELTDIEPNAMCAEAEQILSMFGENVTIKVPMRWDWLWVVAHLTVDLGIPTNVTACMTTNQGVLAASLGARYVSMFWNRIKDGGQEPFSIISPLRQAFDRDGVKTQIIAGSIRKVEDVEEAFLAGAHIVTVPYAILRQMAEHPQTGIVIAQFTRDAQRAADPIHTA